jgi:predicted AAA+ superfamily ATPase
MKYRTRHTETKLIEYAKHFKVILVNGARQVGKSTLLSHIFPDIKSIVFDPIQDIYGAREDPELFLNNFQSPLILDEVQYVPELLPAIKRKVDLSDKTGQFFLTGSQNLSILRDISESLAGRVGILQLDGMTDQEIDGKGNAKSWLAHFLMDPNFFKNNFTNTVTENTSLPEFLWRGTMPGLLQKPNSIVPAYHSSYIQTYIERDVRTMEDIRDLSLFHRFTSLTGALTAQEINTSQFGREIGITPTTARKWLNLLVNTYQWLELPPYHGNTIKRISGKSKGYIRDTGLACYLQRISSPDALLANPLFGSIFETMAVNLINRYSMNISVPPQMYHWRTNGGAEVDIVLELDGCLYPIEVKSKTRLNKHDLRGLRSFRETYKNINIGKAVVIYGGNEFYILDEDTFAVPWNLGTMMS